MKILEFVNGEAATRDATLEEEIAFQTRTLVRPTQQQYTDAIQSMLDAKAQERLYDNILSACTYATSTAPKFKAEGEACVAWRDAVWARGYELMGQVKSGQMPAPTIPELLAMLPTMTWPDEAAT